MRLTDSLQSVFEFYIATGYELLEETDEQTILKRKRNSEEFVIFSYDNETEKYMSSIDKISNQQCGKIEDKSDRSTFFTLTFYCKEKIFRHNLHIFIENSTIYESLNLKTRNGWENLHNGRKGAVEKDEIHVVKEVMLLFRNYIASKKEYRLRLLFQPFSFDDEYEWILNA